MHRLVRTTLMALAPLLVGALALTTAAPVTAEPTSQQRQDLRRVVYVGNNWDGTADVLLPGSFERIGRIDIVPDYDERMAEIRLNPYRLAYFLAIQQLIGEGHDQLVDDMYSSNDGRLLVVSRPSFADVVALDLESGEIVWRFAVDGVRSDHMALSPDGETVVVSASTGNVVHALDVETGEEVGRFASGGSPHESIYLDGGEKILHASIGMVYSPLDDPVLDPTKQERVLQIVDAETFEIDRRYDLRAALDEAGLEDVSTAVRPLTHTPDDETFLFQLSFFHGFVEMDRASGEITRVKRLPNLIPDTPRELYLLDSAHHGISMDPTGKHVCVAGTMSDYAAVVDYPSLKRSKLIKGGLKPYWVTQSWNGKHCYISWSGSDTVSKISYKTAKIVETTEVGFHPQRVRNGFIRTDYVDDLPQG
jgi:hypothetical protein